jgi:hypothetical protein
MMAVPGFYSLKHGIGERDGAMRLSHDAYACRTRIMFGFDNTERRMGVVERVQAVLPGLEDFSRARVIRVSHQEIKTVLHAEVTRVGRVDLAEPVPTEEGDQVFLLDDFPEVHKKEHHAEAGDCVLAAVVEELGY